MDTSGFMRRRRPVAGSRAGDGWPGAKQEKPTPQAAPDMSWVAAALPPRPTFPQGARTTPPPRATRPVPAARPASAAPAAPLTTFVAAPAPAGPIPRQSHVALPDPLAGFPEVGSGPGWEAMMSEEHPVFALSRPQSGVGVLEVTLDAGEGARMLVGLHLWDGGLHLLQCGLQAKSGLPVHTGRNRLRLDLHHIRDIRRFAILVDGVTHGALTTTTTTGARLRTPLDRDGHPAVALTGHNADGQVVLRAETDHVAVDTLQDLARLHGYARTAWRDPQTPL